MDIARRVGAVTRAVEHRVFEGQPANVIVASRTYDTDVEDLWEAITSRERLPRWFAPVSGDFRQGGRYEITGNASGTITRCEPPRALSLTWEYAGQISWVEVRIAGTTNGRAELTLEHIARPDDHWTQFGPGAGGVGWDLAFFGLEKQFESDVPVDMDQAMAWMGSDEGKDFIRRSSDEWYRAAIAAGTEESVARAAANRTVAAYTGESDSTAETKSH
jgi:uncharacterized protein YndB with AHSA1/START domain